MDKEVFRPVAVNESHELHVLLQIGQDLLRALREGEFLLRSQVYTVVILGENCLGGDQQSQEPQSPNNELQRVTRIGVHRRPLHCRDSSERRVKKLKNNMNSRKNVTSFESMNP